MTPSLPKVGDMSDEDMNRAIAKACGWTFTSRNKGHHRFSHIVEIQNPSGVVTGAYYGDAPKFKSGEKLERYREEVRQSLERAGIPRYCRDLNAMHEAEATLPTDIERDAMSVALMAICNDIFPLWHATANRRAQAFLLATGRARA